MNRPGPADEDLSLAHGFAATRWCEHGHEAGYLAHLECPGPAGVAAVLAAAVRAETVCGGAASHRVGSPLPRPQPLNDEPEASLEFLDREGRHLDDRCIPRRTMKRPAAPPPPPELDDRLGTAWTWWCRTVEMRLIYSDCPICSPTGHDDR